MKMSKKDQHQDMISPSEMNKYMYCPYQWYYERLYGGKELRRLYQERNEAYGYEDTAKSSFMKGQAFHNSYLERNQSGAMLKAVFFGICVLLGALCAVLVYFFLLGA